MELSDLETLNPMAVNFHGLTVTFNPDAFTSGFFFAQSEAFRQKFADFVDDEPAKGPDEAKDVGQGPSIVDRLARRLRSRGEYMEAERDFYISLLVGLPDCPVLLSWDLTHEGKHVPCNEEGLKTFKKVQTLRGLWECVRDAPLPKSQGIEPIPTSPTTSETTQSASASPETQADDAPIM